MVQTPGDSFGPGIPPGGATGASGAPGTPIPPSPSVASSSGQSGKNVTMVRRHRVDGTRRLASHTHLPLYVTGCQDGSVRMWEWSHNQAVQSVRPPGVFAKVNRVRFTAQGNKFGVCDGDGNVSLWQSANASSPFFNLQCHTKQTSDFTFQGGCASLFSTAGHSNDGKNVALWDTLLPQKRCMVQAFTFHDHGASSIIHASQKLQLVTAGKKGFVSIWDLRTMRQLHFFKAHDHAVKCAVMDSNEEFLVTGSVAGDIKIWNLTSYKCSFNFPEEHSRHGIFKNISQGVSQVFVDQQNRLFSCGADGSMKVRQLPDRDLVVNSIYN